MSPSLETRMRSRFFRVLFPLVLAMVAPAWARGTLDNILPQIRAQHPGQLSDAEPWTDGEGNPHYRIKWMTPEGRILYFDADARTGRYTTAGGDEGSESHDRRGRDQGDDTGRRDEGGAGRSHWNSVDGDSRGTGDWRGNSGGGDWRGQGRNGGDWGGWRGDANGGDNGGRHHHGNEP